MRFFGRLAVAAAVGAITGGCFKTVHGPARLSAADGPMPPHVRVVYVGTQSLEPEGFLGRLEQTFARGGITASVERVSRPQSGSAMGPQGWPADTPERRPGETTLLIEPYHPTWCGTPAAAGAMLSMMTVGLFPFFDVDRIAWRLTVYDANGRAGPPLELSVERNTYLWLPLVPFTPINRAWRWIDGDAFDHVLRGLPGYAKEAVHQAERERLAAAPDAR